jgi:hypothetical protein
MADWQSSKSQAPSSRKAPNPKHQNELLKRGEAAPTPTRVVERASYADFGIWSLGFFWSLELGILELFWIEFPRGRRSRYQVSVNDPFQALCEC